MIINYILLKHFIDENILNSSDECTGNSIDLQVEWIVIEKWSNSILCVPWKLLQQVHSIWLVGYELFESELH